MPMPRMRVAKAIWTESWLTIVARWSQFSPLSVDLYTSLPSVPKNKVFGSLGWNLMAHTWRPSVMFMRSKLSPPSLVRYTPRWVPTKMVLASLGWMAMARTWGDGGIPLANFSHLPSDSSLR